MTDRLQTNEVLTVPVPHLVARLKQLWKHHVDAGRVSHALGFSRRSRSSTETLGSLLGRAAERETRLRPKQDYRSIVIEVFK